MLKLANKTFDLLASCVDSCIPDVRKEAFTLVTGKIQQSPFGEPALQELRTKWAALLPDPVDATCGSSVPTHKGHLLPISAHHVLGHRSPRHSRATDYSLPSCTFSARHLWVTVIFGRGFQVVFLHFAALFLQYLQHQSSLLLNFLPLGNQLIHIILFVQLSSHCLRIQLPHPQRAFSAQHVLGHRSPPRHSRATDYSLPSCTFSARHLWVTVIFGRRFQVVFLHFAALLLQSLQHQSSLLLNFLPLGNQLIHIILFVQLSSHCLRIQLPHPQRAFAAHHVLGHRSPLRHSRATDFPLPSCTFSARHLWVTVIFGRGFQVVFLHFAALLLQSLQHQSSLLLNFLPLGNQLIHIILFVQLSSHCLRIQLPHPQMAFAAHIRQSCSWPPLSSPQPPAPLISLYRAARSQHGTFG